MTFPLSFSGQPQYEELPLYSSVSSIAPPATESSHKKNYTGDLPKMAATFSVPQAPPSSSATPTLSTCSTVNKTMCHIGSNTVIFCPFYSNVHLLHAWWCVSSVEQPSRPDDYYGTVDNDLKVELTEKLFSLDTQETKSSCNQEVKRYSICDISLTSVDVYFLTQAMVFTTLYETVWWTMLNLDLRGSKYFVIQLLRLYSNSEMHVTTLDL